MSDSSGYSGGQLALAILAGAAAGAVTALLFAPQSGSATRKQLRGLAIEGRDKVMTVPHALQGALGAAQTAFTEALHDGSHSA